MQGKMRLALAMGALFVCALVWSGSAWSSPTMTVSPAIVTPTQTFNVGGAGFAGNEGVDVFIDTVDVALAVSDGSGNVASTPVMTPSTLLPGNHWVTLMGRRDGLATQKLVTVHTGWVQRSWSAFHRSLNPFENVLSPSNISGLEEDWATAGGPVLYGGAAVGTGARQAFFADASGVVRAVSELTGALIWAHTLASPVLIVPTVDSGRVYVHAEDGYLYALNATTGAIVWQTLIGSTNAYSSPAVVANVVYVGSDDDNLYALNGSTGAVIWKGPTGNQVLSSPGVSGGRVFVGSTDGKVYAFAVGCGTGGATCTPLWSTATGGTVASSPAVSNGTVYVGSSDSKLYALNAANGAVLWTGALPGGPDISSPAVANGTVYMPSFSPGVLTAFPAACGTSGGSCSPLWQSPSYFEMETTPAIANGVVYVAARATGSSGLLLGFPAAPNCSNPCPPSWSATQPGFSFTTPIVSDGTVLAGYSNSAATAGGLTAWDLGAAGHAPGLRPDPKTLRPDLTLKPSH